MGLTVALGGIAVHLWSWFATRMTFEKLHKATNDAVMGSLYHHVTVASPDSLLAKYVF
jgi:hypothetical protein